MNSQLLKDNVPIFDGDHETCLMMQTLLEQLSLMVNVKPIPIWRISSLKPFISDNEFRPLYWNDSIVRCELKNDWLVLTLPNISGVDNQILRTGLKNLGFKWRKTLGYWSADYTEERSSDEFRDQLIDTLNEIRLVTPRTIPKPPRVK